MAYDRYMTICHRMHCTTKREGLYALMVTGSWILCCTRAHFHTLLLAHLSFCADNIIPHFFCSIPNLLKLSFSDTFLNELVIFTEGAAVVIFPLSFILVSYGYIGLSILRVPSSKGICKALSNCGSPFTWCLYSMG